MKTFPFSLKSILILFTFESFEILTQQLIYGFLINTIVFFIVLIISQLFSRCRCRTTRTNALSLHLDKLLKFGKNEFYPLKCKRFSIVLPFWMKLVVYTITWLLMLISIGLTLFQVIQFNDKKIQNWLKTLFISFLFSFLLHKIQ
jgi:hypothetical protein